MIDGLHPYPETKPSGVDWLPALPNGWEIHRAKYSFREADDRSESGGEELLSVSHKTGVTPRSQKNITMFMAESYEGHKVCRPGDIVVNTMWAWMAAIGVSRHVGIVSPAYGIYRPRTAERFESKFLDYLLRTEAYRAEYLRSSRGVTTSRLRLYPPDFLNIPFVQPPLDEQRLIVRFLDWHGAQTARLIRAKKKIIALLNEQKQATIHRAVTRGLDPNAKLKPTGIPWLGDVPEGWEVRALKRASRRSSLYGANISSERYVPNGVRFLRTTDISDTGELRPNGVFISEDVADGYLLSDGDFLISRSGTVGRAFVYQASVHGPCAYAGYLVRFVVDQSDLIPKYLWFFTKSSVFQSFLKTVSIASTIENVNGEKYANMPIALPPIAEQAELLASIQIKTAPLDATMKRIEAEIGFFREFRTRLIADVVTGKLDVRAAAVRLPEVMDIEPIDYPTEIDDLDEAVADPENEEVAV
jgi:type I restriction enzyme S subunit